jgi:flagellar hook-associated protein FlgK
MSGISSALSIAAYGLNTATNQLQVTSGKIAAYGTGAPGSNDVVQNVVDLSTEKTAFQASALVLKTADQTMGTLLDMFDTPPRK